MKIGNNFLVFITKFYRRIVTHYYLDETKMQLSINDASIDIRYYNIDNDLNGISLYFDFDNIDNENFDLFICLKNRIDGVTFELFKTSLNETISNYYSIIKQVIKYIDYIMNCCVECEDEDDENDNIK